MPNKLLNRTNRTIECPLPGKGWLRLLPGEHCDLSDAEVRTSAVSLLLRRKGVELHDTSRPPSQAREEPQAAGTRVARGGKLQANEDAPGLESILEPAPIIEVTALEPEDADFEVVGAEDVAAPPITKKHGEGKDENG
jgi:hypothetical protein